MGTLTVRLPDDKHDRLKSLAAHRKLSINKLMEELSTHAMAEFDCEVRFRAFASVGRTKKGVDLLDKLDRYFNSESGIAK